LAEAKGAENRSAIWRRFGESDSLLVLLLTCATPAEQVRWSAHRALDAHLVGEASTRDDDDVVGVGLSALGGRAGQSELVDRQAGLDDRLVDDVHRLLALHREGERRVDELVRDRHLAGAGGGRDHRGDLGHDDRAAVVAGRAGLGVAPVSVVADAIAVGVNRLGGVVVERILGVGDAVTIGVDRRSAAERNRVGVEGEEQRSGVAGAFGVGELDGPGAGAFQEADRVVPVDDAHVTDQRPRRVANGAVCVGPPVDHVQGLVGDLLVGDVHLPVGDCAVVDGQDRTDHVAGGDGGLGRGRVGREEREESEDDRRDGPAGHGLPLSAPFLVAMEVGTARWEIQLKLERFGLLSTARLSRTIELTIFPIASAGLPPHSHG
jgi:hypothetical protein